MKLSFPSPASMIKGLRIIFFHPMLYTALLLHWAIIHLPSSVVQVEELEEELLDESIPIASSASLGVKSKNPPKNNETQKSKTKPKPKPKPLAEALVKSDPKLAKLAEEKKRKEEEAKKRAEEEKKRKEEEAKKKAEATKSEDKKENSNENKESDKDLEDSKSEDNQTDNDERSTQSQNDDSNQNDDKQDDDSDVSQDSNEDAPEFNLELLPNPELIFTADSISTYNPGFTSLTFQSSVADARTLDAVTSVEQAIEFVTSLEDYQSLTFGEPIFEDGQEEEAGVGVVYAVQVAGSTKYVSFIKRSYQWAKQNKKRSLRSTTVFVLWEENPIS